MGRGPRWADYDRWNDALAAQFFGVELAGIPVYLDTDQSVLATCCSKAGFEVSDPARHLAEVVASTLTFDADGNPFREHADRFQEWRSRNIVRAGTQAVHKRSGVVSTPPPSIALLTALVVTAAQMGQEDGMAAHAYYPRLAKLLAVPSGGMNRLRHYFPTTEALWRGLNEFLESNEGQTGLPTAYALGHRYVGLPQSQALIRANDRARLPLFFARYGLAAGSEIVPVDVERMLDEWISQTPSPVSSNLRRLWTANLARERISGVVAVELQHWDGALPESSEAGAPGGSLRLTSLVRQRWGSRSLELSFVAQFRSQALPPEVSITSADGSPRLGVNPVPGSRVAPIPGSQLDSGSLAGSVIRLEDPTSNTSVTRRPRVVVPFRKDDLLGSFVETDRAQLAEDLLVLVKDDPVLVNGALGIFGRFGRHGDVRRADPADAESYLKGLPSGWVLIEGAQLLSVPVDVKRPDLQVLIPATTAHLTLAGGLKLPGRIRKWSSLQPPEIRAVVADADAISVTLTDLTDEPATIGEWSSTDTALVVPTADLELADGDYEVSLQVNGDAVSSTVLRLRSGNTPDLVSWNTCARLNYELADASAVLSASDALDESVHVVDGLYSAGSSDSQFTVVEAPVAPSWSIRSSGSRPSTPPVVLGPTDPNSCVVTGRHIMDIAQVHDGKRKSGSIDGTCRSCGIQKKYPGRPKWKKPQSDQIHVEHDFTSLPVSKDAPVSWDACLDALVHVGGGRLGSLERIASQAEGSSLFLDEFVRTLEGLGQIDVRRDISTLQPKEWEANPAYLAETAGRGFVLAGVWSDTARRRLSRALEAVGGRLDQESGEHEMSAWFARGVSPDKLEELVGEIDLEAYVVPEAVDRMLEALPPLSALEASLPRSPLPQYSKAQLFDLPTASWVPVPGIGIAGAYQIEQTFRRSTWWVDQEGALDRNARQAPIQLVKHFAARAARRPLLAHLAGGETLLVPLGADLPGLYGRVAMLCSGLPPKKSVRTRSLGYSHVPKRVADRLYTLLAN